MTVETPLVCVIGGGPAGLSAALWLHNYGLRVEVLEQSAQIGGMQQLNFLTNDWVLGLPGMDGPGLAQRFTAHIAQHPGIHLRCQSAVTRVARAGQGFVLTLADGDEIGCAALLLATGTRFRGTETVADVMGVDACQEAFRFGPHAFRDMDALVRQPVLIIGGGDNAFENARFLLERGCAVTLAARSAIRAQRVLRTGVEAHPRCEVLCPARLQQIAAADAGFVAHLGIAGGLQLTRSVARVHVLAGYEPNTDFLARGLPEDCYAALRFDAAGYLIVDGDGYTGTPGLYAAGDVCNPVHPCVVTALAQGAQAARAIERALRTRSL